MKNMNSAAKYAEIAKIHYKSQLSWRFDIALNTVFSVTKILFAYVLWGTLFKSADEIAGFTFNTMLTYYVLNSFFTQLNMSDGISGEMRTRIRNGTFSKYMVIPVNVFGYFGAQSVGVMLFYLLFNITASMIWVFIFGIRLEIMGTTVQIVEAIAALLLGLVFMIQLDFFLGLLTFKLQGIKGLLMIKSNIIAFISGSFIPLSLLPAAVIGVMKLFPFYYISYLPTMLMLGRNAGEAPAGIAVLAAWVGAFIVLNNRMYNRMRILYDGVGI